MRAPRHIAIALVVLPGCALGRAWAGAWIRKFEAPRNGQPGKLVVDAGRGEETLSRSATGAWAVEGRRALIFAERDAAGAVSLFRYDPAKRQSHLLWHAPAAVTRIASTRTDGGQSLYLASLRADDGKPIVAILRAQGGLVWKQDSARFNAVGIGWVEVAKYSAGAWGPKDRPVRIVHHSLAELLHPSAQAQPPTPTLATKWRTVENGRQGYWQAKLVYPEWPADYPVGRLANHVAANTVQRILTKFLEAAEEAARELGRPTAPYELRCKPVVSLSRERLISFYLDVWEYTGGAHGNQIFHPFCFGYAGNQPAQLKLADLFRTDVDARRAVSRLVIERLRQREAEWVMEGTVKELPADMTESFVLTPTGLSFLFEPYAVGPYAQGAFYVKVRYDELTGKLNRDGPLAPLLRPAR